MAGDDKTIIKLDERLDVRKLANREELIQKAAFDRLRSIVVDRLQKLKIRTACTCHGPQKEEILQDRRHSTIIVHGSRGSGKTTFIRNTFSWFEELETDIGQYVCFLNVLDPTLIESKENVLVILINKIRNAVEGHRQTLGWRQGTQSPQDGYEAWSQKLKELASGLTSLPGVGSERPLGESWEDPQYVLRKGLEKAGAGMQLEQCFHEFIKSSLSFLHKEAFLLALDDIDTDFKRGWPVLEVMRRYLTSPHLITVLSGDLDLYSMLVRGKQWEQFPDAQMKYDEGLRPAIGDMVDHLQGQYLLKVLAQENRITLKPLAELKNVEVEVSGKTEPLLEFVSKLVSEGFGLGGEDRDRAIELILRQPTRTALSLMKAYTTGDFANDLSSVFLDVLTRYGVDMDALRHTIGRRMTGFLSQFLTKNKLWEVGHNLLPNHAKDDLNLALLTISTWSREQVKRDPSVALDYMLRICFSREILMSHQSWRVSPTEEIKSGFDIKAFCDYLELDRDGSLRNAAGRFVAILQGEKLRPTKLGTIHTYRKVSTAHVAPMYGLEKVISPKEVNFETFNPSTAMPIYEFYLTIKTAYEEFGVNVQRLHFEGNFHNTVDGLLKRVSAHKNGMFAAFPACRVLGAWASRPTFMSVHNLIALVAELLHAGKSGDDVVLETLKKAVEIRTYPLPSWVKNPLPSRVKENSAASLDDDSDEDDDVLSELTSAIDDASSIESASLVRKLMTWACSEGEVSFAPVVLARAWARFYYSLTNLDERVRDRNAKERYLGVLLHRQIVLFLNSLLVEEALSLGVKVDARNPTGDDDIFKRNLPALIDLPASRLVIYCPLWLAYLDPESDTHSFLSKYTGIDPLDLLVEYDVSQLTQQRNLSIQGRNGSAAVPVRVSFCGFYALFNSIAIPGAWRTAQNPRPSNKTSQTEVTPNDDSGSADATG